MAITHASEDTFQQEVLQAEGITFVDFYADWCGPCKATEPIIEALAEEIKDVKFVKVNVDEAQNISGQYSIFSIPTFLMFKGGEVVGQMVGAQSKDSFKNAITKAVQG